MSALKRPHQSPLWINAIRVREQITLILETIALRPCFILQLGLVDEHPQGTYLTVAIYMLHNLEFVSFNRTYNTHVELDKMG